MVPRLGLRRACNVAPSSEASGVAEDQYRNRPDDAGHRRAADNGGLDSSLLSLPATVFLTLTSDLFEPWYPATTPSKASYALRKGND